ncbi:hypothetical protein [Duganella sp. HH101]|uniref:hypothetical protein n=1 Tax=Duganella sp. HH101 TaxID=1781066 RepID=UPI000892F209|nr:hypothetical protein [Duganella sp. HH101]OEZ97466.1 hypothetical protein DUGA2_59880 [Duganella sp. HH101]
MKTIPARMTYLRNAEAVCSFALPVIFCYDWQRSGDPVAWAMRGAALVLISYILLQGVLYWHLKLQSVVQRQPLPAYFQPLYRFFKYSNFVVIAAVAAFIAAMSDATASTEDLTWSYGLLTLAVLEQINYYHYQLMYDTRAAIAYLRRNGRLRKAALGLDLKR